MWRNYAENMAVLSPNTRSATYEYTYDDGDNLVTKVTPFLEDFNDQDYTGWGTWTGTWSASSGYMEKTNSGAGTFQRTQTDADIDLRLRYYRDSSSSSGTAGIVCPRFDTSTEYDDRIRVVIWPGEVWLDERAGEPGYTRLDTNTDVDTSDDTWYDYRIVADGSDVDVWRGTAGGSMVKILTTSSASMTTSDNVAVSCLTDNYARFDDIRMVSDDLSTTTTYVYNDANELTESNGTIEMEYNYDPWGRLTHKVIQPDEEYEACYAYRYGDKLYSVTSDFPGEGDVYYGYRGDGTRRRRSWDLDGDDMETTYYWSGWNVINEEDDDSGDVTTYVHGPQGILADFDEGSPATYWYYFHDHLGSTRRLRDQNKNSLGAYEYTPYGEIYHESGPAITYKYTGHAWDDKAQLYYFPYRYYSPSAARWMTRDPLGMVDGPNVYAYVANNPCSHTDSRGLGIDCDMFNLALCLAVDVTFISVLWQTIKLSCKVCVTTPGWVVNPACWACAGGLGAAAGFTIFCLIENCDFTDDDC